MMWVATGVVVAVVIMLALGWLAVAFLFGRRDAQRDTEQIVARFRRWERDVNAKYFAAIADAKIRGDHDAMSALIQKQVDETMSFFDKEGL